MRTGKRKVSGNYISGNYVSGNCVAIIRVSLASALTATDLQLAFAVFQLEHADERDGDVILCGLLLVVA